MAATLFGILFALGSVADRIPAAVARIVQFIAAYSYSLYLTHHTLLQFIAIEMPGHEQSPALFWTSIVLSNALAMIFWVLFERHYRRIAAALKQRLARPVRALDPASRGVPAR
jgi:peptidoglycan/LPS O-acetylase OafA/YrhL